MMLLRVDSLIRYVDKYTCFLNYKSCFYTSWLNKGATIEITGTQMWRVECQLCFILTLYYKPLTSKGFQVMVSSFRAFICAMRGK